VPAKDPAEAAHWIEQHCRKEWTDWKCGVVENVIRKVKQAGEVYRPGLRMMLNTVPFGAQDYDNAEEKVFGQRFETLASVVDTFEVMTYHQILKRPWIGFGGLGMK
jgi:hypothetical protein